jgi:hypothetical protein
MAARGLEGPGLPAPVRLAWLRFLVKVRRGLPPTARLGVAFDEALGSGIRHALDPAYKAQRPRPDEALKASFRQCRALTRALGIPEAASRRYEADDLLALAVDRGRPRPVMLVSTDKDLLQLLRPGTGAGCPGRRRRKATPSFGRPWAFRPRPWGPTSRSLAMRATASLACLGWGLKPLRGSAPAFRSAFFIRSAAGRRSRGSGFPGRSRGHREQAPAGPGGRVPCVHPDTALRRCAPAL